MMDIVQKNKTARIASKINELEMEHFPKVINELLFPERYDTNGN